MSNTVRIKRSTSTDAPTSLQNAELAYSESADKLYIGVGTGGAGGSATTILPIGGAGTFLTKTLASSTYQTQAAMSGYLTSSSLTPYALLASPSLSGTPTTPTATAGTNTTQIASTAFVATAVANLVASAPTALDTLNELASALGNDASFATTVTTSIGTKLAKASNLSDLTSTSTARTNLGLGTIATQDASNVTITGGSINGVTIDGGTF